VTDARVLRDERVDAQVAGEMVEKDGIPRGNVVIWDRFEHMLKDAGYTKERFPGVRIEGLQAMDESEGGPSWRAADGSHVSEANFDQGVYDLAKGVVGRNVRGYAEDAFYHNQHVFTGEKSFFGKLLTQRLTKIVNVAAFKNTGKGVSMAIKSMCYGSICNTGRLHEPLFFNVCTEVLAAPVVRDKMPFGLDRDGGPVGPGRGPRASRAPGPRRGGRGIAGGKPAASTSFPTSRRRLDGPEGLSQMNRRTRT
jgi:hypothetical protein